MSLKGKQPERLDAFVSFPSQYTQTLICQALVAVLPAVSISLVPPEEGKPPALQWSVVRRDIAATPCIDRPLPISIKRASVSPCAESQGRLRSP